jgi:hypothetical protein
MRKLTDGGCFPGPVHPHQHNDKRFAGIGFERLRQRIKQRDECLPQRFLELRRVG